MPDDVKQVDSKPGATGDGTPGRVNPDEKQTVPKERFDQVNQRYHALQTQVATLTGRLDELSQDKGQAAQPEPTTRYTRAQLAKAVEDGQCTQETADDYLDKQQREDIERTVRDTVKQTMQVETRTGTVGGQLAEYRQLVPEAFEAGHDAQIALERETDFQVGTLGLDPESPTTDLAVLRARYGPIESLKAAKGTKGTPETHSDTGSDRPGGDDHGGNADGAPKGLSARRHAHYQKGIESGLYAGWEAVAKELEHAKSGVIDRADARAVA